MLLGLGEKLERNGEKHCRCIGRHMREKLRAGAGGLEGLEDFDKIILSQYSNLEHKWIVELDLLR